MTAVLPPSLPAGATSEAVLPRDPTRFVVRAAILFKHGPQLPDGIDHVSLLQRGDLTIRYERYTGGPVLVETYVNGVKEADWEKVAPKGILRIESCEPWAVPTTGTDISHEFKTVQLTKSSTVRVVEERVETLIRSAVAALELSTDAHCEVWRNAEKLRYGWENDQGERYQVVFGSAGLTIMPGQRIGTPEQQRFEGLFDTLADAKSATLRGAYGVARLDQKHVGPATRVVFGWALIERLIKSIYKGRQAPTNHRGIRDKAVQACLAAIAQETPPVVDGQRVQDAIERAYDLRNGLAHGEPEAIASVDFPALTRATTLLARLLAHQTGRLKNP